MSATIEDHSIFYKRVAQTFWTFRIVRRRFFILRAGIPEFLRDLHTLTSTKF